MFGRSVLFLAVTLLATRYKNEGFRLWNIFTIIHCFRKCILNISSGWERHLVVQARADGGLDSSTLTLAYLYSKSSQSLTAKILQVGFLTFKVPKVCVLHSMQRRSRSSYEPETSSQNQGLRRGYFLKIVSLVL